VIIITNVQYVGLHVKYQLLLSTDFSKNSQTENFMKTRPVAAELFLADGQAHRHNEAKSRFSKFYARF